MNSTLSAPVAYGFDFSDPSSVHVTKSVSNPLVDHFFADAEAKLADVAAQPIRARAAYFLAAERAYVFVDCALRQVGALPAYDDIRVGGPEPDWSHPLVQRFCALDDLRDATLAKIPEVSRARLVDYDALAVRMETIRGQFAERYGRPDRHIDRALARNGGQNGQTT